MTTSKPRVELSELEHALLWSSDEMEESWAVVSRRDGHIYFRGPYADDELEAPPDDVDDPRFHARVPSKRDLDLGRPLALDFARSCGPEVYDTVCDYFRRKGAFRRFRALIDAKGLTDRCMPSRKPRLSARCGRGRKTKASS